MFSGVECLLDSSHISGELNAPGPQMSATIHLVIAALWFAIAVTILCRALIRLK